MSNQTLATHRISILFNTLDFKIVSSILSDIESSDVWNWKIDEFGNRYSPMKLFDVDFFHDTDTDTDVSAIIFESSSAIPLTDAEAHAECSSVQQLITMIRDAVKLHSPSSLYVRAFETRLYTATYTSPLAF